MLFMSTLWHEIKFLINNVFRCIHWVIYYPEVHVAENNHFDTIRKHSRSVFMSQPPPHWHFELEVFCKSVYGARQCFVDLLFSFLAFELMSYLAHLFKRYLTPTPIAVIVHPGLLASLKCTFIRIVIPVRAALDLKYSKRPIAASL